MIVAPPIVMGAWSMAFLLGQHVEYYLIMMCHMRSSGLEEGKYMPVFGYLQLQQYVVDRLYA